MFKLSNESFFLLCWICGMNNPFDFTWTIALAQLQSRNQFMLFNSKILSLIPEISPGDESIWNSYTLVFVRSIKQCWARIYSCFVVMIIILMILYQLLSCYISSWFRLEFLNFLCLDGARLGMCSKELNSIPQATTVTNHEKI